MSRSFPLASAIGIFILTVHSVFSGTSAVTVRIISYALNDFEFIDSMVHVKAVIPPLRATSTSKLPEKTTGSVKYNINV